MVRTSIITLLAGAALALAIALSGTASAGTARPSTVTDGSATNPDGTSGPPVETVAPALDAHGRVPVGTRLSCSDGEWANDPTAYEIRWDRGRRLLHAGSTYTITRADAGATISCLVDAVNEQGAGTAVLGGRVTVRGARPRPTTKPHPKTKIRPKTKTRPKITPHPKPAPRATSTSR